MKRTNSKPKSTRSVRSNRLTAEQRVRYAKQKADSKYRMKELKTAHKREMARLKNERLAMNEKSRMIIASGTAIAETATPVAGSIVTNNAISNANSLVSGGSTNKNNTTDTRDEEKEYYGSPRS